MAGNVPPQEVQTIKQGFGLAQNFFAAYLGGDVPDKRNVTVKVVATGQGDPAGPKDPETGKGPCCTGGLIGGSLKIFLDTAHPHWTIRTTAEKKVTTVHEYWHVRQATLGCVGARPGFGGWLTEGTAENVAYATMIAHGDFTKKDVVEFMKNVAKYAGDWDKPLKDINKNKNTWHGGIGYLADEFGMGGASMDASTEKLMANYDICVKFASGMSMEEAVAETFGYANVDAYYNAFEMWKTTQFA